MSVYFKFNSELNFSHVGFDGLHISVGDLKKAILHQKRLGKSDFDLLISNAQTKEEYIEDDCLIPKNTSLIVARVPLTTNQYKKWEQQSAAAAAAVHNEQQQNITSSAASMDLSKMNGSEEDKIQAMIAQSTLDYDPTNYQRIRGGQQSGEVPQHYRCHRCHKSGHWIKNCPMNPPIKDHHKVRAENKKMTGIPRSLRENPPNTKEPEQHQFVEQKKEIPEDLLCSICKNIFKDAVMIPCCGSSFCDECIRTSLLESDDNECPECSEKGTSPGSLIPNRFLRNAVAAFHSDSNSLSSQKQQESSKQHEEITSSVEPVEEKITEDTNSRNVESFSEAKQLEVPKASKPDPISDNEEDDDDDDDNITVTVPSASQQSGAEFRESIVVVPHRQESREEPDTNFEPREKSKHSNQYSDIPGYSGYYHGNNNNSSSSNNNHGKSYDNPQSSNNMGNSYQENMDKNYQAHPMSNPNQNPYHQSQHGYNQQHHGNMHMPQHRPQYSHQGQYHQSGPSHQPYYGHNHHQQNMRPMRYEHGNYHGMNKHHNLPPMHAPMNDHYGGMRYQPPSTNLANMVTQNIQQRFGTGIIEDPLEAFNKIMREKEMRKDRFKIRSRSPLRQYSPDMRPKSPIRRRKRTRSFSSGSSKSYSRSRSRSYERHYPKENIHGRDYRDRRKHYPAERKKSETRSSRPHRNRTPNDSGNARKSNYDNSSSAHENRPDRHEKSKVLPEPSNDNDANSTNDGEPLPPGDDMAISTSTVATVTSTTATTNLDSQSQQKDDDKSQASPSEKEKGSADESKHSKKSRDKKKHKKESRKKKKEKRDRKEKKSSSSKSNTPELEPKVSAKLSESMEGMDDKPLEMENEMDDSKEEQLDETLTEHENDGNDANDFIEPELSKWERDEGHNEKNIDHQKGSSHGQQHHHSSEKTEVTSEIIKRAENAIFAKAVNAIRPQEVNKVSSSSSKHENSSSITSVVAKKVSDSDKKYESVQVTVPADNSGSRSIEIKSEENNSSRNKSDNSKPTSIKDRLGKKIDVRSRSRSRDDRRRQESDYDRRNARRPYQLNSCISSVSKYSDRRPPPDRKPTRRSRSIENRSTSRKYDRSRSRSSNRNSHKKPKLSDDKRSHHKAVDEKHENKNVSDNKRTKSVDRNRSRHRTRSPKPASSNRSNERRSRSSSSESKKHKKKKKKEKKSKKKSRG